VFSLVNLAVNMALPAFAHVVAAWRPPLPIDISCPHTRRSAANPPYATAGIYGQAYSRILTDRRTPDRYTGPLRILRGSANNV